MIFYILFGTKRSSYYNRLAFPEYYYHERKIIRLILSRFFKSVCFFKYGCKFHTKYFFKALFVYLNVNHTLR